MSNDICLFKAYAIEQWSCAFRQSLGSMFVFKGQYYTLPGVEKEVLAMEDE